MQNIVSTKCVKQVWKKLMLDTVCSETSYSAQVQLSSGEVNNTIWRERWRRMTWGNRASITFTLVSFRTYRQASHIQTPADDELNVHPKYPVRMRNMTGLTHSKMIMTNLTRPTQIFWEMTEAVRWSGLIIIFFNHYCWIAFHKTLPEINLLPWWGWKLLIPS